jgi:translocation and assembly module TamA
MKSVTRRAKTASFFRLLIVFNIVVAAAFAPRAALAFDFLGLFGSDEPPPPSPTTLPYRVEFVTRGSDGVIDSVQDASSLFKLRHDPPSDEGALVQRINADFAPMTDALWALGYYNARFFVSIGSVTELELGRQGAEKLGRAATAYKNRAIVPITVTVETGPLFKLRNIAVINGETRKPFPPEELPPNILKLNPGDPAKAADLRDGVTRLIDYFRGQAFPLVKAPLPEPTVDHARETMDVTFVVSPGRKATFGDVLVNAPEGVDSSIVRSFIYLQEGDPYSPKALADTKRSVTSIPAVGSVRIREGDALDAADRLPITLDVADRPRNLIGATAGYSTVDGPTGNVYYENRNLFGGAESLRLDGSVFYAPPIYGITLNEYNTFKGPQKFNSVGLGGRTTASFVKPALNGSRIDFLFDAIAESYRSGGGSFGGYVDQLGGGTGALRYRFDGKLSLQAGLKFERGEATDALGRVNYELVGVPMSLKYDNTNRLLDPNQGLRLTATVTPYTGLFGEKGFTKATVTGSTYYAFDDDANYILAGRAGFGSIFGDTGGLASIPANYRFYEGGLATIRGYRFQTVGPSTPFHYTIGGLSAFNATLEGRIKVTDTIGVAPFFDIGGAYRNSLPFSGGGDVRASIGIGAIYYTPIGPIRMDIARPLNPRPGDYPLVSYISIGQPF